MDDFSPALLAACRGTHSSQVCLFCAPMCRISPALRDNSLREPTVLLLTSTAQRKSKTKHTCGIEGPELFIFILKTPLTYTESYDVLHIRRP